MSTLLSLQRVSGGYIRSVPVIQDFSADFEQGEITLLVGPNGAGKSTLLRIIYGIVPHSSGRIDLNGENVQGLPPWERIRLGISLVLQGRANFPYMSVKENLELGTYLLPRKEASEAIERVSRLFPILKERWKTLAGNLSGGEQQILEMAMVLEANPTLLLVDEPSLGLSPKWQTKVFDSIQTVNQAGVTVVIVEQNVRAGLSIADAAIVLAQGKKAFEGDADELLAEGNLRSVFLGR